MERADPTQINAIGEPDRLEWRELAQRSAECHDGQLCTLRGVTNEPITFWSVNTQFPER